jgi:hypothetical protein
MNYYIKLLLIILAFVILAHLLNLEYEDILLKNELLEHMVTSNSDYSNCEIGCGIACREYNTYILSDIKAYKQCVDQCWNY